ncbi:MAG: cytochrome b/b6 domain-containing protein [Gammaproteobacteria bacterium]|nr:cytochrome b/b6 domain-containing protein [Gammaproteobacteria bacterium]
MNNNNKVKVWDILVRVFHWSLVTLFIVAYLTSEEENPWHIYSGYVVLGLIAFRVIWGFVGTRHARFSDFLYSPSTVYAYLNSVISRHPRHYLGHNPAGGWMIMALLAGLFVISISGLKLYAIEEGKGPLAGDSSLISYAQADEGEEDEDSGAGERGEGRHDDGEKPGEEFWEELHEISTNVTLLLIALHIAGVIVSGRLHRENLVKAMITGKKRRSEG